MGKGHRTRTGRADKLRRRAARARTQHDHHLADALGVVGPDDGLLDTGGCPIADTCAGCAETTGLRAVTGAFGKPGGFDVACVTLCGTCDGRSFLHLLTAEGLHAAFGRHATHAQPGPTPKRRARSGGSG